MKLNGARRIIPIILVFLFFADYALAGFGISPPYVINDRLIPGITYEQKISMSRSDSQEDLKVQVTVDAPEIESWFSFDKGKEFVFPKGEKVTSMTVKVTVPEDAALKKYTGYIRLRVVPAGAIESGQVAVALGARIDVDLLVGRGDIFDFIVRFIDILKSEKKPWPLVYFNKILIPLRIENIGNFAAAPTRVHLDVYDSQEKNLLEAGDDKELEPVNPFETKEIIADFKTKLEEGTYYGIVSVYKGDEVSRQEKIIFDIEKAPFSKNDWFIFAVILAGILVLLTAVILIFFKIIRRKK